ncbi:MAG: putative 2OG-Fe(II) oxygenase, partial [Sphingomonas sp.]
PEALLGLDLPPRRVVAPLPGKLVLFPSYFWHGTLPFTSAAPRLTVAFDAVSVDSPAGPL